MKSRPDVAKVDFAQTRRRASASAPPLHLRGPGCCRDEKADVCGPCGLQSSAVLRGLMGGCHSVVRWSVPSGVRHAGLQLSGLGSFIKLTQTPMWSACAMVSRPVDASGLLSRTKGRCAAQMCRLCRASGVPLDQLTCHASIVEKTLPVVSWSVSE
jgi:hypothetical protein